MHMQTVLGVLLSILTCVTKGRLERRESGRSKVLRAILLQERDYDAMSKRGEVSSSLHRHPLECCPSETRRIQPLGGVSRDGKLLELYRDKWTIQRLYETSCLPSVVNQRCLLVDPSIKPWSRCVQKYSYVYAFVKNFNVTQHYRLDYVRVRSGCACEVDSSVLGLTD